MGVNRFGHGLTFRITSVSNQARMKNVPALIPVWLMLLLGLNFQFQFFFSILKFFDSRR